MPKSRETIHLKSIAHGRSGDKGNHANVGIVAYTPAGFEYIKSNLTAEMVLELFRPLGVSAVERYELPGIYAFNFFLKRALAGGASRSLRIDSQGKAFSLRVLELELPAPENLAEMIPAR